MAIYKGSLEFSDFYTSFRIYNDKPNEISILFGGNENLNASITISKNEAINFAHMLLDASLLLKYGN